MLLSNDALSPLGGPVSGLQSSVLVRITMAIETAKTLDELLLLALNEFNSLFGVPFSTIALLRDNQTTWQLVCSCPPRPKRPPPFPLGAFPLMKGVVEQRQPVQIAADAICEAQGFVAQQLQLEKVSSLLLVPLVAQDSIIGILFLATVNESHYFAETEIVLARLLASQLAAAMASFQITEAVARRNAELATLNDIAAAVTSSLDPQEVYHLVVQKLNEYFQVGAGSLLMRDDLTGSLEFVMTLDSGKEKLAGQRLDPGQGVAGHVAETQHYEIVHDAQNDPRFYSKISESVGFTTQSILCVPMVVKGRTIGVIELLNKRNGEFTEEDAERLTRMAATVSVAIENARLFQQVATGRDRFQAILNSSNDGILMADMQGTIVTANLMVTQLIRIPQERLTDRPLKTVMEELHDLALDVTAPPWIGETKETINVIEFELGGAQHSFIRHFLLPVHDANRAEIGQLALFQDISKERELNRLRDDYTGMLVHDLRAPLTAIMNGVMMVKRGLGGPITPQQQELLDIAYQSSQAMLEMINTLLDIARMEEGQMTLHLEPVLPELLVNYAVERITVSAQSQNLVLQQQLVGELPLVAVDREKMVRVLQNLLDNAIKFSPQRSKIVLSVVKALLKGGKIKQEMHEGIFWPVKLPPLEDGEWLLIWVKDEGPGIPVQYHERIFEKFGQVRGRKVRGTGLGLTFCKLATEAHKGHIWLEAGEENKGSIFALALPFKRDSEEVN